MSSNPPSTVVGARASTAGDVFHELWALRAALGLLVPGRTLQAITVEGVAAPPTAGYTYDGVDCALFHEGVSFETAKKLELLQLKYSTTDPTKPWTVARLTYSDAKKGDNSVLRKLADTFKQSVGRTTPGAVLIIRLVSNQPLDVGVASAIANLRAAKSDADAGKIAKATGLAGQELLTFLEILDFSEMGATSRSALHDSIAREVSELLGDHAEAQVLALQTRIRQLMLPGSEREIVTQSTVLSWFGIASISGLFPAPPDIRPIGDPIERRPATDIRAHASGDPRPHREVRGRASFIARRRQKQNRRAIGV